MPESGSPSLAGNDVVLFVEDSDDLREMFVDLVNLVLGRRCIGVASYDELMAHADEALNCRVAIIDINLGANRPSGIDVYTWLRNNGFNGRIAFLTGHASHHPLVVEAKRMGGAAILSKPIDADRLRALVEG